MHNEVHDTLPIETFGERAYLDYAMYVIHDRALPFLGDGLKPVQRRIIYGMHKLRLGGAAKPVKSARTVGDVLGKYHPHGDTACYEAMVLMAQPFSFRYPLIHGQGNWGAPDDPKSFAAMRYTEAKLSNNAALLLEEIDAGTVDFTANFDGGLQEPAYLPARVPLVLANGGLGIAVGMATTIPPHNLNELIQACVHLLMKPKSTLQDLMCGEDAIFMGPDFPTEANIITDRSALVDMYEKGKGSVTVRARWRIDENAHILIDALPWQVSPSKVLEKIGADMEAKKLPMLVDIRDESDHANPTRLVLVPKSKNIDYKALMAYLFVHTDLEANFSLNFNVLGLDGRPKVYGLVPLLKEWLTFREQTVRRRIITRIGLIDSRIHILEGLCIVFAHMDEVIQIIRTHDPAKAELMSRFQLSETQVEHILELRLRKLSQIEEHKLHEEKTALVNERERLQVTLDSPRRMKTLLKKELIEDGKTYGDLRRTAFEKVTTIKSATKIRELVPREPATVVLSRKGWIRLAKGAGVDGDTLSYKSGDEALMSVSGHTTDTLVFTDSNGRFYSLAAHGLASARGYGEPLTGPFSPPEGATFIHMALGDPDSVLVCTSSIGYGFVTTLGACASRHAAGKAGINAHGGQVLMPIHTETRDTRIAVITNRGYLWSISLEALPVQPKGKGVKLINIPEKARHAGEHMMQPVLITRDQSLLVHTDKGTQALRPCEQERFFGKRGLRGRRLTGRYTEIRTIGVSD